MKKSSSKALVPINKLSPPALRKEVRRELDLPQEGMPKEWLLERIDEILQYYGELEISSLLNILREERHCCCMETA